MDISSNITYYQFTQNNNLRLSEDTCTFCVNLKQTDMNLFKPAQTLFNCTQQRQTRNERDNEQHAPQSDPVHNECRSHLPAVELIWVRMNEIEKISQKQPDAKTIKISQEKLQKLKNIEDALGVIDGFLQIVGK
ncbi:Hypothetical_protein [Hexamita inflata]|uniref:Hypothetical_protein n=1 Tax=Hexamita inflata TaxID=28002 RepID=A0AA86R9R3_9EUKA|nr:Hypothetical protein HINF_LOCUS60995 [Hexamita inflata]